MRAVSLLLYRESDAISYPNASSIDY